MVRKTPKENILLKDTTQSKQPSDTRQTVCLVSLGCFDCVECPSGDCSGVGIKEEKNWLGLMTVWCARVEPHPQNPMENCPCGQFIDLISAIMWSHYDLRTKL